MAQGRGVDGEIQGFFCPVLPPGLLRKRLASGKCEMTSLGLELRCAKCVTYWPMDTEFWFSNRARKDGMYPWCRACYVAHRWPEGRSSEAHTSAEAIAA